MRYRYRCGTCRTTSPVVRTRTELYGHRDSHRRRVHGGMVPDGEKLLQQRTGPRPAPTTVALVVIAALVLLWIVHG